MAATLAAGLFFYSSCTPAEKTDTKDYTQYVNTFIGGADNGHTFPGACYPFGMIQTSPVTGAVGWRYCSEYVYEDSLVWGFTQTHLNGTGCMDLGDILVMPVTGTRVRAWDAYRSHFPKDKEAATPGYYTTELSDPQVKAELTASIHAALHRYTYHKADSASILIDLQHGPAWREEQYHSQVNSCEVNWEDAQTLTGHVNNTVWVNQDYFFVMKFNRPVVDSIYLPMGETEKGKRIIASFDMQPGDELMMKVALSTTSVDGAKKNLEAEIPAWDFEGVKTAAHNEWNNYLSRIEIDGTDDEKTNFYTCFYHALIQPNQISDVDGMYRNAADSIVKAGTGTFYSTFSLWDTYRAAHPFYTLMIPERVDGFVNSLIEQGEVQGFLPIWGLWGKENFCMIGNHGVPVVAEACLKDLPGIDQEKAYQAIRKSLTENHYNSEWDIYDQYGYLPVDLIDREAVSKTLEFGYDDYSAALLAKKLGKQEDYEFFMKRAEYYKNLFDPETKLMRGKDSNGKWRTPFNPFYLCHGGTRGGDYTEGNAWQYSWHVQQDVDGLVQLMGGKEAFAAQLDTLFELEVTEEQSGGELWDVTGLIGQYAHGNEPSHHVIYLYSMIGKNYRTAELAREICDKFYQPRPDGLCGNDDCGQMSAWYMFTALGFYPVNPASGEYVIGSPQLPEATIKLANGKTFTMIAENLSAENKYVKSVWFNDKEITDYKITYAQLMDGGVLKFEMTDKVTE